MARRRATNMLHTLKKRRERNKRRRRRKNVRTEYGYVTRHNVLALQHSMFVHASRLRFSVDFRFFEALRAWCGVLDKVDWKLLRSCLAFGWVWRNEDLFVWCFPKFFRMFLQYIFTIATIERPPFFLSLSQLFSDERSFRTSSKPTIGKFTERIQRNKQTRDQAYSNGKHCNAAVYW